MSTTAREFPRPSFRLLNLQRSVDGLVDYLFGSADFAHPPATCRVETFRATPKRSITLPAFLAAKGLSAFFSR
jgi:hypothetical protein